MVKRFSHLSGASLVALLSALSTVDGLYTQASDLRVEYQAAPLGLSEPLPRFSFIPQCASNAESKGGNCPRGTVQRAYQVLVTSLDTGDTMWDSGKVVSNRSSQIEYAGKTLAAYSAFNLSVQWWADGVDSTATASSTFEMGPIALADWKGASWLKGPRLSVDFALPAATAGSKLVRARAYIAAPGGYTMQVNGKACGDQIGVSMWLRFDKSIVYQTLDITSFLSDGTNKLDLLIGKGFWHSKTEAAVMARVVAVYSDGKTIELGTAPGSSPSTHPALCGTVKEKEILTLACPAGKAIGKVAFASFGTPSGDKTCESTSGANKFSSNSSCDAPEAMKSLQDACAGKVACTMTPKCNNKQCTLVPGGEAMPDPCFGAHKHLNAAVTCVDTPPSPSPHSAWLQTAGPVQADDPFVGTTIDWRLVDGTGVSWQPAEEAPMSPAGTIRALSIRPAGVLRTVSPTSVKKLKNGHLRFDFPENFVGVVQLKLATTPANGSKISIKHGEVTLDNGNVSFPWHESYQTDLHILGPDVSAGTLLTPRFTWHGFQFAEVAADSTSGFDGELSSVMGLVVGADIAQTGTVEFSGGSDAKMLTAIQGLVTNSQRSNFAGYIPTDCPTREKHGWLGDAQVTAEEALFNFDMAQVYTNYLQMIEDDQHPSSMAHAGDVLGVVPKPLKTTGLTSQLESTSGITDISWSAAYPLITRWLLRYYGDVRVISKHWSSLKIFVDQLTDYASSHCAGGLADYFTWGDWCPVESRALATPGTGPELAAFNYILSLDAMVEMASTIGATADASKYAALAQKFRPVFHQRFFNQSVNAYGARELELQSLTVAPLALGGVVPDAELPKVITSLSDDIKANDNHFTVGSVGAKHLLPQLTAHGLHSQAMAIATQTTFPSFGYWLANGATTCWENYRGIADDSHPPPPTHNHIFLCGGVGEWMYRSVAGISPASDGYDKLTIAPQMGLGPSSASAHLKTVRGLASVSWKGDRSQTSWTLNATVPVSSLASVALTSFPASATVADVTVRESGAVVWQGGAFKQGSAAGVLSGRIVGASSIEFEVTSGAFHFEIVRGAIQYV